MGTKIQSENCHPGYFSMRDLNKNANTNTCNWPAYRNDRVFAGPQQFCNAFPSSGYEKDAVKKTMLHHEAVFREQVYELHRLYRVQRVMMEEIMKGEESDTRNSHSHNLQLGFLRKVLDLHLPGDDDKIPDSQSSSMDRPDLNQPVAIDEEDAFDDSRGSSNIRWMIDINVPVDDIAENEGKESVRCEFDLNCSVAEDDDTDRINMAAEAILSISKSEETAIVAYDADTSSVSDSLRWFCDVVCSSTRKVRDSDYFESMTLNLPETKTEDYMPKPIVAEHLTAYPFRRQPRRGRKRRDFQRDILPGLASLSRHEVTEDLQTFGATARKNCSRGRRRSQPLMDKSFTGWGNRRRRGNNTATVSII